MFALAAGVGYIDIALIILYLAATAFLGWLGFRHTKTAADYLLAGRKTHPFIMAMSYGATFISTSAIVGFGGVAAMFGMSLLWLTFFNIFVGIFISFVFLGPATRRLGHRLDAHTFPELLGRRYDSKLIHVMAGLIVFLFMPLYAAAVLIGGTEFLATAFNMNYQVALLIFASLTAIYVFFGGLKGVLYTDALQGSIMTLGMIFLIVWCYITIGGVTAGHESLAGMANQVSGSLKSMGHQGWTKMPAFGWGPGHDLWWIVIGTLVLGVGIGVLAQPQLVVRFLTVKSSKELNRALTMGGVFILLMTGVAFTVGALSNVYFARHEVVTGTQVGEVESVQLILKRRDPGQAKDLTANVKLIHIDTYGDGRPDQHIIVEGMGRTVEVQQLGDRKVSVRPEATAFTRAVVYDDQTRSWMLNSDNIIPTFVTTAMPRWFKVVFLLTLLSAAMSTMSGQYHTLGAAAGRDVFEQLLGPAAPGSNRTIHIVRGGIVVGLILAVTIGYYTRGGYFIARATSIFFGLCASTFLPAFVGGLFFKRVTRPAVIASMLVGFFTTSFWLTFVKAQEAGAIGIVRLFTDNKNSILQGQGSWAVIDPILIALPLSAITLLVVSLITRPLPKEHLDRCFETSQPAIREPQNVNA